MAIVSLRRSQAIDILEVLASITYLEAAECEARADVATQVLREYYQQPAALGFNLDEALESPSFTDRKRAKDNPY